MIKFLDACATEAAINKSRKEEVSHLLEDPGPSTAAAVLVTLNPEATDKAFNKTNADRKFIVFSSFLFPDKTMNRMKVNVIERVCQFSWTLLDVEPEH